ncbi:uncharacterized protein LOC133627757 [Colius striatus]|uniref:uncharacterized protein LOC133627757 n=1 Tax=Colius striatus TaxID=57412 RepID=UPI002B1DDB15|nr:uncharacterized protein LOC133627757 [Colius striatus]
MDRLLPPPRPRLGLGQGTGESGRPGGEEPRGAGAARRDTPSPQRRNLQPLRPAAILRWDTKQNGVRAGRGAGRQEADGKWSPARCPPRGKGSRGTRFPGMQRRSRVCDGDPGCERSSGPYSVRGFTSHSPGCERSSGLYSVRGFTSHSPGCERSSGLYSVRGFTSHSPGCERSSGLYSVRGFTSHSPGCERSSGLYSVRGFTSYSPGCERSSGPYSVRGFTSHSPGCERSSGPYTMRGFRGRFDSLLKPVKRLNSHTAFSRRGFNCSEIEGLAEVQRLCPWGSLVATSKHRLTASGAQRATARAALSTPEREGRFTSLLLSSLSLLFSPSSHPFESCLALPGIILLMHVAFTHNIGFVAKKLLFA